MVSLAIRTASSSSAAGITDSTGPKISSWAMTELLSTLPNTVGSMYQPRSRSFGRPPPVGGVGVPGAGDHDPGQRRADLAGQEALGLGQGARGGLDVGIVEDNGGRLAAELQGAPGDPLAADGGDPPPGRGRPGEGDLVDPRVADQQLGHLAIGGDDVEDAGRQARGLGRLRDQVALAPRLRGG